MYYLKNLLILVSLSPLRILRNGTKNKNVFIMTTSKQYIYIKGGTNDETTRHHLFERE